MIITAKHPKYLDFLKNERKTLEFIGKNNYISSNFRELSSSAMQHLSRYKNLKDQNFAKSSFSFNCNFDIEIENDIRKIIIESILTENFSLVSYCLSICHYRVQPYTLVRKFHFDYAVPIKNDQDPKPVYHMQYGGKQSPELTSLDIDVSHLQPWLSSPRLFFTPINLALLLDMVFCEFRSEVTNGVVERPEWRDFIKNNETFLLKPYIGNLNQFINTNHKSDYLLRDYYYGH
jgi:hypothetical protein